MLGGSILELRVPITIQNFAPLKSPLNILVIVLLRKFSKEFSKDFSKDQNFASESGPWSRISSITENFGYSDSGGDWQKCHCSR